MPMLALLALPAAARIAHYELDPVHTRVLFTCNHFGYSNALGTFSRPTGTLSFDPDDWSRARLDVSIDLTTLDLGDAQFNQRILRRDFLDAQAHPVARFVSTQVEPLDRTRARVHGLLSLRGVERPLTLEVTLNRLARNRYTMRRTAGFSARATLPRADFGITASPGVIGAHVELRIEAEAVRSRATR